MWTLEMSNLARQAKHFYWKWKNEGGNNRESDSYRKMRDIKKCLRSEQRKLEAQKRNEPTNELTLLTVSASTCFNFNFISISTNFSYSFKSTLFHFIRCVYIFPS
jgi:hypothetical protein